ncbi:MAG: type I-C CRISPR-associated endonuclease Cas1 [Armatimonadetes bacterium]|nr:type I-C CRISPR-associated endonuclease Cas1 [Armatimonadota bacterium]
MALQLLNTLYVQTPEAYLRLDHDTLRVEANQTPLLQVPLHHVGCVVLFGTATISAQAMQRCVREGRPVVFLDTGGRFRARVTGPVSGNVLLRLAQYDAHREPERSLELARRVVAAKLHNSRLLLLRGARDAKTAEARQTLTSAAAELAGALGRLPPASALDDVRGVEGEAAAWYFGAFGKLLTVPPAEFAFARRTRRPPRDRVNALLSFLYTLLTSDCTGALEGVGLDPQIGFLHAVRPGRPALALDLAEEFRAGLVDRLVLTLINLRQIRPEHFEAREDAGGTVLLNEEGRKAVLMAYQKRKQEPVQHRLLRQPLALGLVPHVQARLLARHLRGDLARYPPFLFGARARRAPARG